MKLQYLAVIFIIIIMPIEIVLSQYIDYQIDAINLKHTYNTKLLDATYDSIKAYQLNTVNNAISDIPASKIEDLEAAVKAFFNSLTTNFNYDGYNSSIMKDYVPAVVFTMYDGYYIYSPYQNILTGVPREQGNESYVDDEYQDNKIIQGIKPYVYYSCRYINENKYDVVITYTLDNYITIQGNVKLDGNGDGSPDGYINKSGYLIDGIEKKEEDTYIYDNIEFTNTKTEKLTEFLGPTSYSYAKINGTKYYLSNDKIFHISSTGEERVSYVEGNPGYKELKNFIENNNSAYRYYKDAYNFTEYVHETFGDLKAEYAVDLEGNHIIESLGSESYFAPGLVFGGEYEDEDTAIQDSDSNFNAHRSAVIRYTIEKNLPTAITGFKEYSNAKDAEFIMPKVNDTDWETLENNISIITFLQGFKIAGKDYNKYCVVANNLTKEYIDENDIYILADRGSSYMYYRPNDTTLKDSNYEIKNGIWKLNFERKNYRRIISESDNSNNNYENYYYYPIRIDDNTPYLASYSSVVSYSRSVNNSAQDMYKYMRNLNNEEEKALKENYYTALGRERWGAYSVNNNSDNIIEMIK